MIPPSQRISVPHVAYRVPSPTFELCIPTQADRPPSGPGWLHEIKHDGFRLIERRDADGVRLITRNRHDWSIAIRPSPPRAGLVGPKTLIVQSTDYSHFLTVGNAALRDQETLSCVIDKPYWR